MYCYVLLCIAMAISLTLNAQLGAFRVSSGAAIQMGYNNYKFLSFGISTGSPNNGAWAIEHWDGGLNFWKPFPTSNAGNYKMFVSEAGVVGINMKSYSLSGSGGSKYKLQVNGRIVCSALYLWSDQQLKMNVSNLDTSLQLLLRLRPVSYHFIPNKKIGDSTAITLDSMNMEPTKYATCVQDKANEIAGDTDNTLHFGFIAQEVKTVLPNLVGTLGNLEAVNYVELIPMLVKSIQQQQKQIEDLKEAVHTLEANSLMAGVTTSKLYQNEPNPFDDNTYISYYIDENVNITSASIEVRDLYGILKESLTLTDISGLGQVKFEAGELTDGF
jgi:hypothetical protein